MEHGFPDKGPLQAYYRKNCKEKQLLRNKVACKAFELAEKQAEQNGRDDRTAHVGYFIAGKGVTDLRRSVGMKAPGIFSRNPLFFYIGSIFLLTLITGWILFRKAKNDNLKAGSSGLRVFSYCTP